MTTRAVRLPIYIVSCCEIEGELLQLLVDFRFQLRQVRLISAPALLMIIEHYVRYVVVARIFMVVLKPVCIYQIETNLSKTLYLEIMTKHGLTFLAAYNATSKKIYNDLFTVALFNHTHVSVES